MEFGVGSILDGKVTGITKFGAFVALPEGKSGLVHISEIAYSYVNQVSDHLKEGQEVKVKVIGIDQAGRINLSIKQTQPRAPRPPMHGGGPRPSGGQRPPMHSGPRPAGGRPQSRPAPQPAQPAAEPSFEDKLKQFMSVSDSKQSELNRYMSGKRGGGRRRK